MGSLLFDGRLLLRDPRINPVAQHVERQRSGVEHLIVEGAQVEVVAQSRLSPVAQFQNLQLADLVGQCLAGPRDVAVHLGLHLRLGGCRVVVEVIDHLLAGPVLGVDAGIDDEADGAHDVALEAAIVGVGVLVEAHILAQPLGVEPPALDRTPYSPAYLRKVGRPSSSWAMEICR